MLTIMTATPPTAHVLRWLLCTLLLASTSLVGCDSGPTRILDSDVPRMPGMEQRIGFDIKRRGGELVGGVFIFIGPLQDMQAALNALASRFRDQGWTLEGQSAGFPRSSMLFSQGDRRVQVIIDADQLEPAMSRAQFKVSLDAVSPSSSPAQATTSSVSSGTSD